MDTGKFVEGFPAQTVFRLPPSPPYSGRPSLVLERGAHNPSPAESLAPFHQDPSQRIVALVWPSSPWTHLVLRMGPLLGFLQSHEGSEVGWDEWKAHAIVASLDRRIGEITSTWVSGRRFFCPLFERFQSLLPDEGARFQHAGTYRPPNHTSQRRPPRRKVPVLHRGGSTNPAGPSTRCAKRPRWHCIPRSECYGTIMLSLGMRLNWNSCLAQLPRGDTQSDRYTLRFWAF